MSNKIVIGVAGMPGAGKSIVVEVARKMGFGIVVMGDEIRKETENRNLGPTPENMGKVMLELRQENGPAIVAKRCISRIKSTTKKVVIVDGVRSLYEVDEFQKHLPQFKLLAIHVSPETRFKRLFKRKRSDDPAKWEIFLERDWRELRVGLGSVIASADVMIVNEGKKVDVKKEIQNFLESVMKNIHTNTAN
ncbi:MAG: flagellar hook-basal body complex protein FliE [Candidatus Bathyarchaeota archaeon]|nr:MAG: flagellar hook-basal body complex protein FliE [Candidatus Bathyarchaeota archaeon]